MPKSNLRTKISGQLDELYFTTSSNATEAVGDIKIKYKDLEFKVLGKDRLKVNKFLTKVGSLFIDNGSKADSKGYRYGEIKTERDPTKSYFNYIWLQIKDGIISVLTGSGKKE